ncbi:unnamed protein product [Schistosoma turkestanicum]|nr:unnamed protein product [Schistosoma turkestanicum]
MPQKLLLVCALYDYNRQHTDELSFKKGDLLTVSKQLEGGWWEGSLNGYVGWFPSNYVTYTTTTTTTTSPGDEKPSPTTDESLLTHLQNFQNEIIQHILEGELRQVSELSQLLSIFLIDLEPLLHLSFLNKLTHLRDILIQTISIHQHLASALSEMKRSHGPKCMGRLFLDFASAINAVGCDYSKIYLHVITGLEQHVTEVTKHMRSFNINLQLHHCKQQLTLVFERLSRYPLLLKEMERYLEEPHIDRDDILRAMHVYGEISERCAILRKFKEYDINVLLSIINGWQGPPIQQLNDPILTLRVLLVNIQLHKSQLLLSLPDFIYTDDILKRKTQLSLLVIFPTCVLLLARTNQSNVYDFTAKIPLNNLAVISSNESETDLELLITDAHSMHVVDTIPCQMTLACTDQNARDLLVSTLTDLIQYQIHNEQQTPSMDSSCPVKMEPNSADDCFNSQLNANPCETMVQNALPVRKDNVENEKSLKMTENNEIPIDHHHCDQSIVMSSTVSMKESANIKLPLDSTTNDNLIVSHNVVNKDGDFVNSNLTNNHITTIHDTNEQCILSSLRKKKSPRPLTEPLNVCAEQHQQLKQPLTIECQSNKIITPVNTSGSLISTSDLFTSSSSLRYLPHRITNRAHIHWLGHVADQSTIVSKQHSPSSTYNHYLSDSFSYKTTTSNEQLSCIDHLIHPINCLRIDGPMNFAKDNHATIGSVNTLNKLGLFIDQPAPGLLMDSSIVQSNQNIKLFESNKESRRKRGDRQKSAITAEDVLRSTGKIHENELRTADDTTILQVIEAYCASSWMHYNYRALDSGKNESRLGNGCGSGDQGILSPVESKTLLQQFRYPKKLSTSSSSSSFLSSISTTPLSSGAHLKQEQQTAPITEFSRQSAPLSLFNSKASLKRSESTTKNKSQTSLSQSSANTTTTTTMTTTTTTAVYLNQHVPPIDMMTMTTTGGTNCTTHCTTCDDLPAALHQSVNYAINTQCESILKTFSPPPVILPTRSGRR